MEAVATAPNNRFTGRVVDAGFGYGFATFQNPSWTLDQILLSTGGRLLSGNVHAGFRSISTDSRTVKPGDLFLALSGERYDGAAFAAEAIKRGATGIITDQSEGALSLPTPVVHVDDTLKALGDLASFRRNLLKGVEVLAITGSSGKTTVKDMTASILDNCGNVIKTKGNFNNLVGLPLSLLPVNYRHDYAVLEMGMNTRGEIARLTEIADPDVACINNIHPAHLAGVGSIEGVARAKGELFENCRSSAVLVVNLEDKYAKKMAAQIKAEKITFGRKKQAYVRSTHITRCGLEGVSFTLHIGDERARVHLNVLGEHNVLNGLAAAAMAYSVGTGIAEIVSGLESFKPEGNRLGVTLMPSGLKVINDSYNANPSSMQAALATVQEIRKGERTVAVLGDMLELGAFSREAHCDLGKRAAQLGFDYLLTVGEHAGTVVAAAKEAGMSGDMARSFADRDELAAHLSQLFAVNELREGDLVLLKGSRGMRMEEILKAIRSF